MTCKKKLFVVPIFTRTFLQNDEKKRQKIDKGQKRFSS